ncbi:hypothetical protein BDV06DRAFT_159564 [Aspergillus oleicola]
MSDLDEFAQTRGADDLFDDEIIPVSAEEQTTVVEVEPSLQPSVQAQSPPQDSVQVQDQVQTQAVTESLSKLHVGETATVAASHETDTMPVPNASDAPRSRGGERRGRGRGRGGRGRGARDSVSRRSDGAKSKSDEGATETESREGEEQTGDTATTKSEEASAGQDDASAEAPRVPAVRGDRSATGGVKKEIANMTRVQPKLTEEELSQRIALARENAARKAAAHARAEADQASFEEREKVAEKKRREERANRRVMDNEREKNRLRKLEALNGREWDAEKPEEQFSNNNRGGQYRRGMHGGVAGGYTRQPKGLQDSRWADASPSPDRDDSQSHEHVHGHGYGRGRGRGGRGGRGRGGHSYRRDASGEKPSDTPSQDKPAPTPVLSNEAEFPSLPGGEKKEKESNDKDYLPSLDDASKAFSPISGATWADQVEAGRD